MSRCQANSSTGPCSHQAIPGSDYCRRHTRERDRIKGYRLNDPSLAERTEEFSRSALHDLSDQIALMRALIEQRLNFAQNPVEQQAAFKSIGDSLVQLTKMTESFVKLSKESGLLMTREEVEEYIDHVIEVVSEELRSVPDREEIVDRIVARIEEK